MANKIENFKNVQLDLIIDNDGQAYIFNESIGDYIRMSVTRLRTDSNLERVEYQFYSNRNLTGDYINQNDTSVERQIPVYTNNTQIYVKPNEILESNSVVSGQYRLQFDFMKNYFYTHFEMTDFTELNSRPEFYINQISPSRKEVRLYGRLDENQPLDFDTTFQTRFKEIMGYIDEKNQLVNSTDQTKYLYDYFLSAPGR